MRKRHIVETRLRHWIGLLIIGYVAVSATAQKAEWSHFNTHTGLGSDCIMDIAQDGKGGIWMATNGGLCLYENGQIHTFTRSRHPEAGSIVANDLNQIWPDPSSPVIWIATQRDGLDAYNYHTGVFTHYQADGKAGSLVDNSVTSISPSRTGGIWLTSYMGGISHYNRNTDSFTLINSRVLPGLVSDAMWCLTETTDSTLYVGHVRNGISHIDLKTGQAGNIPVITCFPDNTPAEDGVRAIVTDSTGLLWLGTEKGLACMSQQSRQPVPVPGIRGLVCHLHITQNKLWISTRDMGLWTLDLGSIDLSPDNVLTFHSPDVLQEISIPCFSKNETSVIRCALPDNFGNLWIGTDSKGVQVRLHLPQMFHYTPGQVNIRALELDKEGCLWAGTQSDGIFITDPQGQVRTLSTANSGLGSHSITTLRRSPDGDIWIGTEMQGLYRWNHDDGTIHKVTLTDNDGGNTIYVWSLAYWNNRLVAGTYQGLFLIDPVTETFTCHTEKNSPLPEQYIFSVFPDSKGNLWCGSALNGLVVLQPDMNCRFRIDQTSGLPGKTITSMLEADDGTIWAATEDGLVHISHTPCETPSVDVLREDEGLPHPSVQAIAETESGRIWCSTPDGIYIIGIEDTTQTYKATLCYPAERIGNGSFRMNTSIPLPDGYTLWAGEGHLSHYSPSSVSSLPLPHYHVSVSCSSTGECTALFNVPDIALSDKTGFRYRIDGGPWYETGTSRHIILGSLSCGPHRLDTSPCFIGYRCTDEHVSTTVIRIPYPWKRIAIWSVCCILLLGAAGISLVLHKRSTGTVPSVNSPEQIPAPVPSAADKLLLEKAEQIVDKLMQASGFDKNRLAQELCMSPSTLYRRLKSAAGVSPNEYIRQRRLLRARQLLQDGHTVSETAALVGMSVTYLGRCYKETFGISPSEVRP